MLFKLYKGYIYYIYTMLSNQDKKEKLKNMMQENSDNIWITLGFSGEICFAYQFNNDKYKLTFYIDEKDGDIFEELFNFIIVMSRVEKIECKYENRPEYIQKLEVLNNET